MTDDPVPAPWCLYLVRTAAGMLYTGISTNPDRRLQEHAGSPRGARALRGRGPLELVYRCEVGDRGAALRAERAVKRLSRRRKLQLVDGTLTLAQVTSAPAGACVPDDDPSREGDTSWC